MLQILEVAIGLVLVFTLISLGVSVLVEWLSSILAMRGKLLWKGIETMVGGSARDKLRDHPLLKALARRTWFDSLFPYLGRAKPSYVPAKTFSAALLGILQDDGQAAPGDDLKTAVGKLPTGNALKRALQPLVDQAGDDLAQARANMEHWFDTAMDRVTGWYKRWSQLVLFVVGFGVASWFGVDSLLIGRSLWVNDQLRGQMVEIAGDLVDDDECKRIIEQWSSKDGEPAGEKAKVCLDEYQARLVEIRLPLVPLSEYDAEDESAPQWATFVDWVTGWIEGKLFPVLLPLAVAALLLWLDARHRPSPAVSTAQRGTTLAKVMALAGRVAIVLVTAATLSWVLLGLLGELLVDELPLWLADHLTGFLVTGLAVSFGAPFWFDLLGRLVKLRNAGARPEPPSSGQPSTAAPSAAGK